MRQMKDSGIEWIGEISVDWSTRRIKFFSSISSGEYIDKSLYNDCGIYDIVGSNGVIGKTDKANVFKQIITTGRVGTIGSAYICENVWVTDNALILQIDSQKANIEFIKYVIPLLQFGLLTSGTAQPLITATTLKNQYVPFPSVQEQQQIAFFLDKKCDKIDTVIAKTKATIEEYNKLKQSIITEAVTKGIRGDRPMKDSENIWFRSVPDEWGMQKIKYLFRIKKDIAGKEGYTILSITQRGILPKDVSKNEGQLAENYSNYQLVNVGDFAMNHMDLLTGWVDISRFDGVTSPDYRVFVLKDQLKNRKEYYLYLMQLCYFNRIFYGLGQGVSGMGRWRLQADKFLNFLVPVPPVDEQKEIADYLDKKCAEMDALIAQKTSLLAELESYKKSVIYEYVTGKKEV